MSNAEEMNEVRALQVEGAKEARATMWRVVSLALGIILALVTSIWAITYDNLKCDVQSLQVSNLELQKFVSAQAEINKTNSQFQITFNEKLDAVMTAVGATVKKSK